MVRRKSGGGWLLFTQDDHAKLSARIMSFWGGGFFFPDPAAELLFAIAEHDSGWRETDGSPSLNPGGEPEDFTEVSPPRQTEIWRKSFGGHIGTHPYASALIALHFKKFNDRVLSRGQNDWSLALKAEIEELVKKTLGVESTELISGRIRKELKLLQTGDAVSLVLCHGWESFEIKDIPLENGGEKTIKLKAVCENSYSVDPWPFSHEGRLSFDIRFSRADGEKFDSNRQLSERIGKREKEKMSFFLFPASPESSGN